VVAVLIMLMVFDALFLVIGLRKFRGKAVS